MLKNILKLEGAQQLSRNEQKNISGGAPAPAIVCYCLDGSLRLGVVSSQIECSNLRIQYCNA